MLGFIAASTYIGIKLQTCIYWNDWKTFLKVLAKKS